MEHDGNLPVDLAVEGDTLYTLFGDSSGRGPWGWDSVEDAQINTVRTADGTQRWATEYDGRITAFATGAGAAAVGMPERVVRLRADDEVWEAPVPGTPGALTVTDDRICGVTREGTLFCCVDGETQWQRPDSNVTEPRAVDSGAGSLVVVSHGEDPRDYTVVCVTSDGSQRWWEDDPDDLEAVLVTAETVYVLGDSRMDALDTSSGERKWAKPDTIVRPGSGGDGTSETVHADYHVTPAGIFRTSEGFVQALDDAGRVTWSSGTVGESGVFGDLGTVRPGSQLAADQRGVFVELVSGRDGIDGVAALSLADGSIRWSARQKYLGQGPVLVDSGVLVATLDAIVCHWVS
ncbi:hypothetical protein BRC64_04510 [Halobacteriales archaeon QH_10_67_22]|nr:MAG: hypothetical protein BRC64_04510 [Halobacteriales archaeon QH_10_67_22]